jgi:hypothetical protein
MQLEIAAMLCLTFLLFSGLMAFAAVLWKATQMAGASEPAVFRRLFGRENIVRLLTVSLVIACATYLGLTKLLDQAIISLFAGIAGFVLGGLRAEAKTDSGADSGG